MTLAAKQKYNKQEVTKLVEKLKDKLNTKNLLTINEYIEENEWGVAFKLLCEIIYDDSIYINKEIYIKILELANGMKINNDIFDLLKEFVVE